MPYQHAACFNQRNYTRGNSTRNVISNYFPFCAFALMRSVINDSPLNYGHGPTRALGKCGDASDTTHQVTAIMIIAMVMNESDT